jgi:endonuclease YncB( thermonuclease family)
MLLAIFLAGAVAGMALQPVLERSLDTIRTPKSLLRTAVTAPARGSQPVEVVRLSDGDTFVARVRVASGADVEERVRLRGIDRPEMSARCRDEYVKAVAARDALGALLRQGGVSVSEIGRDRYGRMLARVSTRDTADVSRALLAAGHGRPYEGGRRESWCAG